MARAAGVSQSAVSRALTNLPGVSAATRTRIVAIADEMGYRPDPLARSLSTRRSGLIGVVVSNLANPFICDVLDRILRLTRTMERQVMVFAADSDQEAVDVAAVLGRYRVELSLVISPHVPTGMAKVYARLGPSVVLFNRLMPGLEKASSVFVDNHAAGAMVAKHLMERGHRTFGFLHGVAGSSSDQDRYDGFCQAIAAQGLAPPVESWGGYTYSGGSEAARTLLAGPQRPSAIFAANDAMAMGVIDRARLELGLHIPRDLAVVGFDDVQSASWMSYELTTVHQPIDAILSAGLGLLPDGPDPKPRSIVFPPMLIERGTT